MSRAPQPSADRRRSTFRLPAAAALHARMPAATAAGRAAPAPYKGTSGRCPRIRRTGHRTPHRCIRTFHDGYDTEGTDRT